MSKTTKQQRADWRSEYMRGIQCPGCAGTLPMHQGIVRSNEEGVIRCSWGDTMTLLDDVDTLETSIETLMAANQSVTENSFAKDRKLVVLQSHLDYAYALWACLPERLRQETLMLGEHLHDECSEEIRDKR